MNDIDRDKIIENLQMMINLLEFDAMRSPGKTKLNSQHLHSMYWLLQNVYKVSPPKRVTKSKTEE